MTHRVDRTLPHHAASGLVVYTQPRRLTTLDDRTPDQIRRAAQRTPSAPRTAAHTHFRNGPASRACRHRSR